MPPRERSVKSSESGVPEEAPLLAASRHLLQPNGSIIGRHVAEAILPTFTTFASAIPTSLTSRPALASIDGRHPLTHVRVAECVEQFGSTLHQLGFGCGDRIALVLPNGPELALAIVAVAQWASCVPLSANGALSELEADLQRCGADLVIGPHSGPMVGSHVDNMDERFKVTSDDKDWSAFASTEATARKLGIPFVGLVPSPREAGVFRLQATRSVLPIHFDDAIAAKPLRSRAALTEPNAAEDEVLVLFTSGTTGNKKLVPHQMGDMLTAAATIALSWNLTVEDVCANSMPLFHVGGIVRQVFSPLFSGGCVICCPAFDPSIFWALLTKRCFTWYYAAPTMHQLILQTGKLEGHLDGQKQHKLRMIANAAGGLLPSLAEEMREVFDANVLPSYGMTECMPISSPPANYRLEKPGTSGVPVGPEVAILNTSTVKPLKPGEEGPICVRGAPCFRGYGQIANDPSQKVAVTFLKDGWFNTGDLGYMDEDGYLYITGRSKEVINRGGEIISPMEVEEAITSHPDVAMCAAFSALHNVLQEVVGICIVMKAGRPRLDLAALHEYLGERLAAPKWPQCVVFMEGLPKSHTNKLLRVKLCSRLGLPELSDDMAAIDRTFEAACPPQGTALDVSIPTARVVVSPDDVQAKLQARVVTQGNQQLVVVPNAVRTGYLACYLLNIDRKSAIDVALETLDRYAVPSHFVIVQSLGVSPSELPAPQMSDAVASILQGGSSEVTDPLISAFQEIFTELLVLDYLPGPDANFFHLGGSSMLASQLASKVRKRFSIACSGSEVFQHATASELSRLVRQRGDEFTTTTSSDNSATAGDDSSIGGKSTSDHGAPFPAERLAPRNSFWASAFQLVPMFIIFPVWQVSRYLLFFCLLLWSIEVVPGDRDIGTFILAYLVFHTLWITVTPLIFVAIKWIVIGRYQAGRYPIWGSYYLRWWFVDVCRKLFLRGIWGSNTVLLNAYYRMLGAKIGKGARISLECDLAEFDLVEVGKRAAIEMATLRGFGVDNGAMILGRVRVGDRASLGVKSVVAPFTSVPDDCHLGPVTSSYDVGEALHYKHARVNRQSLPEPCLWIQMCVIAPITFLVNCVGQLPPLVVLLLMLRYKGEQQAFTTLSDLMEWLCTPQRIKYYIGIRVARALLSPFFYMTAAIFVKRTVIGKFEAGPRDTWDQWELTRHALAATLFSRKKIQNLTDIIGRHYELVSVLYRLLGAKVGKRVFWPGHQPVFSGEFDLLEVGDDVVFGSRSSIFFITTDGCEKVALCAGSNVADNCVVLPGSIVGKNAVLGSNSICPEGWYLPEGSVWFGSKGCEPMCLEKGAEVEAAGHLMSSEVSTMKLRFDGDETTLRPFGKAFYLRKAPYFVLPLSWIVVFSLAVKTMIVACHTLPLLAALHSAAAYLYGLHIADRHYAAMHYSFFTIYMTFLFMYLWMNLARVALWLAVELTAKWTLLGRRQVGRYNYDTSSYAQRWEVYQLIAKVRKFSRLNFLDFFSGTPFMSAYFRWNGGKIGKDCCLYPAGADPFMPEPDLVVMGDRCVIDCASIVCHLNTRGNFELAKITLENGCTLRARSRVQQAVHMEQGAQLLEKTVVMTGEVIEAQSVWQGCPATWWFQYTKDLGDEESAYDDETTKLLQSRQPSKYN